MRTKLVHSGSEKIKIMKNLADYIKPPTGTKIFWDNFNRPYYLIDNLCVYLSKKSGYNYSIAN